MKYSVSDFTGPLLPKQREWLDSTLREGELILWATRPRVVITARRFLGACALALILLTFGGFATVLLPRTMGEIICGFSAEAHWSTWVNGAVHLLLMGAGLLLGLFLLGLGLLCIAAIYTIGSDQRQTLYVLTNKRALCLTPDFGRGCVTEEYSLHRDMVWARKQGRGGESLIFRVGDAGTESGWMNLRDADEAQEHIAAAVNEWAPRA